jgi:hypothetical protein
MMWGVVRHASKVQGKILLGELRRACVAVSIGAGGCHDSVTRWAASSLGNASPAK